MRGLALALFACFWLSLGMFVAWAANNIVIQQANGQNAIIATTEVGGVHTLNVVCTP